MQPRRPASPPVFVPSRPVHFKAGEHTLSISLVSEGRWVVSVNDVPLGSTFATQVDAWEAGVRAADGQPKPSRP